MEGVIGSMEACLDGKVMAQTLGQSRDHATYKTKCVCLHEDPVITSSTRVIHHQCY